MKRILGIRYRYLVSCATISLFVVLLAIALWNSIYQTKHVAEEMIVEDLARLVSIFERIHHDCTIIGFDHQRNSINFLNVINFVGSELGSMNLAHPENWHGPYVDNNPTLQGVEYQIVRTKKGYFITPGDGVKLPNGLIIGKNILLDANADIATLITLDKGLRFHDKPLAVQLPFAIKPLGMFAGSLMALDEEE